MSSFVIFKPDGNPSIMFVPTALSDGAPDMQRECISFPEELLQFGRCGVLEHQYPSDTRLQAGERVQEVLHFIGIA